MTKNFSSDIVIKKRKKHFLKKLSVFILFVLSLALVVFLADILSTALTAGKFSFAYIKSNSIKIEEKSLYAVTMGKSEDKFQAFNIAGGVSILGAGGYVWEENNTFYVVANIYSTIEDANTIVDGLSTSNYSVDVLEIKIPNIKLDASQLSKNDKKKIQNSLNRLYSLYEDLYNMAINIDTKNITFIQGGSLVNGYKSECKIIINELNAINASLNLDYITKISNTYVYVAEILDTLVYKLLKDGQLNYIVKNAEIEIVYEIYNLIKSL